MADKHVRLHSASDGTGVPTLHKDLGGGTSYAPAVVPTTAAGVAQPTSTAGRVSISVGTALTADAQTLPAGIYNASDVVRAIGVVPALYNGLTADIERANLEGTILASAARTATTSSADQTNNNGGPLRVFVNVTAVTADPSVVFTIEVKDPVSGTYTAILTSAAVTGVGHTVLTVALGVTAAANLAASNFVGRTWRVTATHGDADSITYSVAYQLNRG